jgi:hypothetical protein
MVYLMKRRWLIFGALGLAAVALAQTTYQLVINGKPSSGTAIVVKGETYVPLKALQAAGVKANVSGGKLSLSFGPEGGANQSGALEGGINDWLFNGVWRFQVLSVSPLQEDRTGWQVRVELRNGTKADNIALSGTGLHAVNLVLSDGKVITPYNITEISDAPFPQGGGKTITLTFYEDEIGDRKAEKLLVLIKPDSDLVKYMKDSMKLSYSTADPSFRVKLQ